MTKQIALVTGVSHGQGIGAATCRRLAELGADVFFIYWHSKADWKDKFQREIGEFGGRCAGLEVDLSDPGSIPLIFHTVINTFGTPTILVNNAAHSTRDGYMELNATTLDNHYAVNIRATCLLSVEFARRFKAAKSTSGRIINLTSGQDLGPMTGELAYIATKGAISAFTKSLSAELAPLHITVNAVNPGPTDTGWMDESVKNHLQPKFLMGRMGEPMDAAKLIGFLASEDADWITGQVINSEGGFLRG